MSKSKFTKLLKNLGVLESVPVWNRDDKYYTVIKVLSDGESISSSFIKNSKELGYDTKVRRYLPKTDIWIFKFYTKNGEKED